MPPATPRFSLRILAASLLAAAALGTGARLRADEVQGLLLPFKQVSISSSMPQEIVAAMKVEEGDAIQEGQVLVELLNAKEKLAVEEGHRLVENADFVAHGTDALVNEGMGSREAALKAKTKLELAKIRLAAAEEQLAEMTIHAPLSGIVVKKYKESGEAVDRVEKLLDIVDIDHLRAQFYVAAKYLPILKVKQSVNIRIPDLDNAKLTGEIDFVDPRIDAGSGLLRVTVLIENKDHRVKSGLKGIAEFPNVTPSTASSSAPLRPDEIQGLILPLKQVSVPSPVLQEVIEDMAVTEGDLVKEGQVLVQLRNAREKLAVQEAQKMVENAEFVARGTGRLFNSKTGSQVEALKAKTDLELAKIRLATAQEQLQEKTIHSTISGIVVKKYKETGETVDRSEKLLDIVDIDQVRVQFYVTPKYFSTLKMKQPVSIRVPDLDDLKLTGEISLIDPRIDAGSGLLRVLVLLENRNHQVKSGLKGIGDFASRP